MNRVEQFFAQAKPGDRGLIALFKPSVFLGMSHILRVKAPKRFIVRGPSKRTSESEGASLTVAQVTDWGHALQMFASHTFSWIWCKSCDETVQEYLKAKCRAKAPDTPVFNGRPLV